MAACNPDAGRIALDNLWPADRRIACHYRQHTGFCGGSVDLASQIIHPSTRLARLIDSFACTISRFVYGMNSAEANRANHEDSSEATREHFDRRKH